MKKNKKELTKDKETEKETAKFVSDFKLNYVN